MEAAIVIVVNNKTLEMSLSEAITLRKELSELLEIKTNLLDCFSKSVGIDTASSYYTYEMTGQSPTQASTQIPLNFNHTWTTSGGIVSGGDLKTC